MSDDKIVNLQDRIAGIKPKLPSKPVDLATKQVRDLAVKAVIYPQLLTAKEAHELGAAVLYHLKLYYPALNDD